MELVRQQLQNLLICGPERVSENGLLPINKRRIIILHHSKLQSLS
jgi:hypothetical protein